MGARPTDPWRFSCWTRICSVYTRRNQSRVIAAVNSHATDQLCVSTVTLEEQIGGWSALARSAKTPQAGEHAGMLLASLVVSWNRFAITPMTVSASTFESLVSARIEREAQRFADRGDCQGNWSNRSDPQSSRFWAHTGLIIEDSADLMPAPRYARRRLHGAAEPREGVHPDGDRRIECQSYLLNLKRLRQSLDLLPDFRCQAMPSDAQLP